MTTTITKVKKPKKVKKIKKPKMVFLPAVWLSDRLAKPACKF